MSHSKYSGEEKSDCSQARLLDQTSLTCLGVDGGWVGGWVGRQQLEVFSSEHLPRLLGQSLEMPVRPGARVFVLCAGAAVARQG